jgi:hypothetical protein
VSSLLPNMHIRAARHWGRLDPPFGQPVVARLRVTSCQFFSVARRAICDAAGRLVRLKLNVIDESRVDAQRSCLSATRRQPHDLYEEFVDLADGLEVLVEVDGLGDVGVGVQFVAAQDVLLGRRGGEHHDGNVVQGGVGFQYFEDLPAVVFGQVEVEQDEVGSRGVVVLTAAVEKVQAFCAVAGATGEAGASGPRSKTSSSS